MKIGSSIDPQALSDVPARAGKTTGPAPCAVQGPVATDQVAVSAAGSQLGAAASGDFDQAKVDAIRVAIQEGRFSINAGAIADRLIADAAALLGPRVN